MDVYDDDDDDDDDGGDDGDDDDDDDVNFENGESTPPEKWDLI